MEPDRPMGGAPFGVLPALTAPAREPIPPGGLNDDAVGQATVVEPAAFDSTGRRP